MERGLCVVITGSSGSGKTTVIRRLLNEIPNSARMVTTTSRESRPSEVDGVDYNFVSRERFMQKVENGDFLEWEENYGNLYGSEKDVLNLLRQQHQVVFVSLDTRGAITYKKEVDDAITIALFVPPDQIPDRIAGRAPMESAELDRRVDAVMKEQSKMEDFDYVVENLDSKLESHTIPRIKDIVTKELESKGMR